MTGRIQMRLNDLGLTLPPAPAPAANYVPFVISGALVHISGQIPMEDGNIKHQGKVGADLNLEQAQAAARLCALNLLAQLKAACDGDLDRVRRCIKLGGFVNASDDFEQHPAVINAASDLFGEVFGEAGRHARFAVGANSLPFNVAVEIDGIFEISSAS